jgi:methionyl-tRNA formyltransferase
VHFSLLPKYRGAAPVNWAIVRGESVTGVTTMQMDDGLDTGAILLQRETGIGELETAPELMGRLAHVGADLLGETLSRFEEINPRAQLEEEATLAPLLRREDGLIDWSLDAFEIERRVRGFQPWPNAYTSHGSRRLLIWRARPERKDQPGDEAGRVIEARGDELRVACGERTALRILEVQPEGKRRMSVRDFLNGMRVRVGERFG